MLQALYDYFYSLFSNLEISNGDDLMQDYFIYIDNSGHQLALTIADYFATLGAIISLIFIVVLCCLFVYKIIKLIGGLIR